MKYTINFPTNSIIVGYWNNGSDDKKCIFKYIGSLDIPTLGVDANNRFVPETKFCTDSCIKFRLATKEEINFLKTEANKKGVKLFESSYEIYY